MRQHASWDVEDDDGLASQGASCSQGTLSRGTAASSGYILAGYPTVLIPRQYDLGS